MEPNWIGWWLNRAIYQTIIRTGVVFTALVLIHL